jgi:hypothetical protein
MQGKLLQTDLSIAINRRGGALAHNTQQEKRREEEKSYTPIFILAKFSIGSE